VKTLLCRQRKRRRSARHRRKQRSLQRKSDVIHVCIWWWYAPVARQSFVHFAKTNETIFLSIASADCVTSIKFMFRPQLHTLYGRGAHVARKSCSPTARAASARGGVSAMRWQR
jgi:hypothetical protein